MNSLNVHVFIKHRVITHNVGLKARNSPEKFCTKMMMNMEPVFPTNVSVQQYMSSSKSYFFMPQHSKVGQVSGPNCSVMLKQISVINVRENV